MNKEYDSDHIEEENYNNSTADDFEFTVDITMDDILADIGQQVKSELDNSYAVSNIDEIVLPKSKKRIPVAAKVVGAIALIVLIVIAGVYSYTNHLLNKMNYESRESVNLISENGEPKTVDNLALNSVDYVKLDKDDNLINVLLIGEEAIGDTRGRSDTMILLTLNKEKKSVKITSFMRDLYVQIPGYNNNKLNEAYRYGGGPLLVDTLELNFNVDIDAYARVNFEDFENIINKLGGVQIELTASEAKYLNTTNYISDRQYRNVKSGMNTLNGNQARGYCRVRYRKTAENESDDFGRTSRQRKVIKAIFDAYKRKSLPEMISIMDSILEYVTTDMTNDQMINYLTTFISFGTMEMDTFRIPINNSYSPEYRLIGKNNLSVIVPDFNKNSTALDDFLNERETETTASN